MPTEEQLRQGFRLGDWEVLPLRGVLRKDGQEEKPEPRVFGVLIALARRDGDLVTRDELVDELWDGRPTSDEPINRCLSQLRRHLGDQSRPHRYVETLTRRGYRLMQPVELLEPAADDRPPPGAPGEAPAARWKPLAAVLFVAALAWLAWTLWPPGDVRSIGVVPFENASQDPANNYLVAGFKDELVNTLHNIPEFTVKSSRVEHVGDEVTEIASSLGVDAVLSGRVHRVGDDLQIFYTVEDGRSGDVIATAQIEGPVSEIFQLQEDLARMVRRDLFGKTSQQLISRTRPASFGAYDRYMRGLYAFDKRQDSGSSLEEAIELFQETIRLDENFGPAYLMLANAYLLLPTYRDAPADEMSQAAIATVEEGMSVDESIRDAANAIFGFVHHQQMQWLQAEEAYRAATSADVVDPNAFNWYSRMLASVGRLDASLDQALLALEMDPTSAVINSRVALAYLWLGDTDNAEDFFARSAKFGAGGPTHMMGYALFLFREGRSAEAYDVTRRAVQVAGGRESWIDPVFAALEGEAGRDAALGAVDEAVSRNGISRQIEFIVRTVLGDLDGAMSVARLLESEGEVFEMDLLFIPEVEPLREHPEFGNLLDALGISDYWRVRGCTWTGMSAVCEAA
ncbi:MAG TPA: winged helix-turn-helix domain-containing protein [Woeseiaceae bacterium]|nr:winged helix-turn-helix domain-containing protein [Woeseiaceae bacterium]